MKEYKISLLDPVLAYGALKSANLSESNEKLIMATVNDVALEDMMLQIRKDIGM